MDSADIENRFAFHPATPENNNGPKHDQVRVNALAWAQWLNTTLPEGREKSLAITHLEETMFWANAAIARA